MFPQDSKKSAPKIPTKARLRNIALYYLERFESSEANLRSVLKRRIDKYAFFDKDYNPSQAYQWVEEIVRECLNNNFVDDKRFADFKINNYLNAGKSRRYIVQKLKQKGIDEKIISDFFETCDYNESEAAFCFAKKKKIACFRKDDSERMFNRQKDLATLVRAGFDYDIAKEILDADL